jgi:toxin-antitoxin system PIN domain toxin
VILVDANLLVYATDADSPHHARARAWLEALISGATPVGLAWLVILAFLRVTTRPGVLRRPYTPEQALDFITEWLGQPYVSLLAPGDNHWPLLRNLLKTTGTAGNLVPDAHLAALAIEHGCALYSADYDFKRFPGVEHINPLA